MAQQKQNSQLDYGENIEVDVDYVEDDEILLSISIIEHFIGTNYIQVLDEGALVWDPTKCNVRQEKRHYGIF